MSRLLFVAAPYAADTPAEVLHNVRRAVALGRLAITHGFVPFVPHAQGLAGLYGPPFDEAPATRDRAIDASHTFARLIARVGGRIWILERDDGSLSAGVEADARAFLEAIEPPGWFTRRTWDQWTTWAADKGTPLVEGSASPWPRVGG